MHKIHNILFLLVTLIIMSSCADESNSGEDSGKAATVKITMQVPQEKNVSTRSLSLSENESTVNNLTVLIFNSDDQLIGINYVASPTGTDDTYQISVDTHEATSCTIYAVANAGANAFISGNDTIYGVSSPIITIDEFKATYAKLSAASDLGSQSNVIMEGVLTGESISAGTTTLSDVVPLYRLCTKMNFNIKPASNVTITGYQLHELPLSSYIADRSGEDTAVYNPLGTYEDLDSVAVSSPTAGTEVIDTCYLYENLAGTVSASSTAKTRNSTNAPATASYLDVSATGPHWKSVYRIYLGGTSSTDYTNYNILRNYNYTYTIGISSSGVYDVRVTCYPELISTASAANWSSGDTLAVTTSSDTTRVGDYYFSDGTWGSIANNSSKTPIAVIFSASTSATDQSNGWTHGYALALQNASTATTSWGTYGTDTPLDNKASVNEAVSDLDGYTNTQTIKSNYTLSTSSYSAFYDALNYGVTAPSSSSGWYLPSMGQWYQIAINLGKLSADSTSWSGKATATVDSINTYISGSGSNATYATFDFTTSMNFWFWASTELSSTGGYIFQFNSTSVAVNAALKYYGDVVSDATDGQVRAVIAF